MGSNACEIDLKEKVHCLNVRVWESFIDRKIEREKNIAQKRQSYILSKCRDTKRKIVCTVQRIMRLRSCVQYLNVDFSMSFWMEVTVTKRQFIATNFAFAMNLIMFGWSGCRVCKMPISIKFADFQQLYQLYNCISMWIISVASESTQNEEEKKTHTPTNHRNRSLHIWKTFFRFILESYTSQIDSGPSISIMTFCYFRCVYVCWCPLQLTLKRFVR